MNKATLLILALGLTPEAYFKQLVQGSSEGDGAHHGIVYMDLPDHSEYRKLTPAWLQLRSVRDRKERIRTIARATARLPPDQRRT